MAQALHTYAIVMYLGPAKHGACSTSHATHLLYFNTKNAPVSAGRQVRSRGTLKGSPGACSSSSSATLRSTALMRTDTLSASLPRPSHNTDSSALKPAVQILGQQSCYTAEEDAAVHMCALTPTVFPPAS